MSLINEAVNIVENYGMQLVGFKDKLVCHVTNDTPLFHAPHYRGVQYYGRNLYALVNEKKVLLETYDDEDEITGAELAQNVIDSIKEGLSYGATYYRIPCN